MKKKIQPYKTKPYITVSPASVWFTKQYPKEKWSAFLRQIPQGYTVYLLGAPSDKQLCEQIRTTHRSRDQSQRRHLASCNPPP